MTDQVRQTVPAKGRREPVALEDIAAAGGVRVILRNMDGYLSEQDSAAFYGICAYLTGRKPVVLLNTRFRGSCRRFTFAHELAHAAHGIGRGIMQLQNRSQASKDAEERLCNRIAAEVLMPADLVLSDVLDAGRVNSYALARRFRVSLTAMRVRLKGLGLL